MQSIKGRFATGTKGGMLGALVGLAAVAATAGTASAQTYGFATLPPGTLNHTTASAISKVLKEKAGMNVLVQPTAGDNVIIPMVGRGEAEIGIANAPEIAAALEGGRQRELRLIGTAHPLRTAFWVRKDAPHAHDRRSQRQAGGVGLFGDADDRSADARDARDRRLDREGRQSRSGAQRDPQRR